MLVCVLAPKRASHISCNSFARQPVLRAQDTKSLVEKNTTKTHATNTHSAITSRIANKRASSLLSSSYYLFSRRHKNAFAPVQKDDEQKDRIRATRKMTYRILIEGVEGIAREI
jgi:hypothetical protein